MTIRLGFLLVIIAWGTSAAQTQVPHTFSSGQPARASEVNENFDALETAIDTNAADSASQGARLDAHFYQIDNLERALINLGREYGVCSARNLSACGGFLGDKDLALAQPLLSLNAHFVADPVTTNFLIAIVWETNLGISTDPTDDSVKLAFGRQANFTRGISPPVTNAEVLVDSCTDPTVYFVPAGEPRTGGLGVNSGKIYLDDREADPVTVDVTGGTYGLIHDWTSGFPTWDHVSLPPLCFLVSDRKGLYDSYPLILQEDTSTWGEEWSLTAQDLLMP